MQFQNIIINYECKRLFCVVEIGEAYWRLYRLPVVTHQQSPTKMVGLFWPGSKIRRYTRYINEPTMALGACGDYSVYRSPHC